MAATVPRMHTAEVSSVATVPKAIHHHPQD